ncbi:putative transcription factor MYB-HB-like family [Medicago truncatula]|uniref:Myb-like transcription factor family protein n=1 Tax=Medicago truncatula TaxID=3880 RepID=A0A072UPI8_MEDTR|nr:myb family transcription factor EFM isoform X1 [Medicago truncatula]KEH30918.1 myb-like transcription factor family protein [Medicago truncatula]RHN62248.1 putative transcription factor MYB-HB-like family [Medicago truncatula]
MGCVVPAELSLDLRPTFVPKTIANFLFHLSTIQTTSDKLSKLHDFLSRLEDELNKIDAFKRELPLSMLLLNDAILVLKEELEKCTSKNSVPVLEEFIPLKKEIDQSEENKNNDRDKNNNNECSKDKKNWMSSVQLWNNNTTTSNNNVSDHHHHHKLNKLETTKKREEGQSVTVAEDLFQSCSSNRNGGSAFMPFSAYSSVPVTTVTLSAPKEEKEEPVRNRLSFLTPEVKSLREGFGSRGSRSSSNRAVSSSSPPTVQPSLRAAPLQPQQTSRKQRRCWSPELHRRFVNALQKLGGSQAATPKQIRELMQVDGLTNDEVKSHLQKYRLHTRRVPAASGTDQSVVVLGGLWMPQEHYNDSSKGSSTASGSPQSPLHLATGSRGGTSPTEGDSMEDDDDEKSESYSWKSHIHRHGKVGV